MRFDLYWRRFWRGFWRFLFGEPPARRLTDEDILGTRRRAEARDRLNREIERRARAAREAYRR